MSLPPMIKTYNELFEYSRRDRPISALHGNNVNRLLDVLGSYMPEGPKYYPDDQITDHPEQFS